MVKSDYPKKYADLIDAQTWAFIEETCNWYPPETIDYTVDQQREIYNRMCRSFHAGNPEGVQSRDGIYQHGDVKVPVRHYKMSGSRPEAQVLYCHGGGFVVGGLESHDDVCAEICAATGYNLCSVDYRLAPEFTYPADFYDVRASYDQLAAETDLPIVVAGDSAGGNLAAALCHAKRGSPKPPIGQVLIYPGLGSWLDQGTFVEHSDAPLLSTKETTFYKTIRTGGDSSLFEEPTCAPLNDSDFFRLPPTVVISAECDPLSGDGHDYCDAIQKAGGKAVWINEAGLVHGYLRARHTVKRAAASFDRITQAVAVLGKSQWPY